MAEVTLQDWDLMGNLNPGDKLPEAPPPDETWELDGGNGTAWVYYATSNKLGLTRPVILSDGFHKGKTELKVMWDGLEGDHSDNSKYTFITDMRSRGHDMIILGYKDCTVSILDNARSATECIMQALAKRVGDAPLAVGGFSMGGLITRYALARMEMQRMRHETATYICYDSPHHGAWMPIGIQALAHSLRKLLPGLSAQVNSVASRQLLWRHLAEVDGTAQMDPERTAFLEALKRVGDWPQIPRLIGVSNGTGRGNNGVPAAAEAVRVTGGSFKNTVLYTQASQGAGGKALVADLKNSVTNYDKQVYTSGLPEADGAHGGTLDGFGLAAGSLGSATQVTCNHPLTCFVPSGSAIATRTDPWENLGASVADLAPEETSLHSFKCASQNDKHTLMTKELGSWILDQLDRAR